MRAFLARRTGALIESILAALILAVVALIVGTTLRGAIPSLFGATSIISGYAYTDLDRDGVRDPGEAPLPAQKIYLADANDSFIEYVLTDLNGYYEFGGLSDSTYIVKYSPPAWWVLREEWVPTTTGSIYPRASVDLQGVATIDFGWRAVVHSADLNIPISTFVGASGLTAEVFNDVVDASTVYDTVMRGLTGPEAPLTTIRVGYSGSNTTSTSVSRVADAYTNYRAVSYVSYTAWLDGELTMSHEYGHAWSLYYAYIVQQDPELTAYLTARGLTGDPRLGSSYAWQPRELIAEDYRQLFGPESARSAPHMNWDLPPASEIAGLADFLRYQFTGSPPTPSPSPAPSASPSTAPTDTPTPSPSPSPDPSPTPSSLPTPEPAPVDVSDLQVEPTPVKSTAQIRFQLSRHATVSAWILDARGTVIRQLALNLDEAGGSASLTWDRRDSKGRRVRAGDYSVVVSAADGSSVDSASSSFRVT